MSVELFAAVLTGDRTQTADLLAAGADVNAQKTAYWHGAIEMASLNREYASRFLTMACNNRSSLVIWTWTPLLLACAMGHWDIAADLLDEGANADVSDEQAQTPLVFAIRGARPELVRNLLRRGANANATLDNGYTPLMTAAALGRSLHLGCFVGPMQKEPEGGGIRSEVSAAYS
jgi:ankyrin repeat protein